MKGRIYLVTLLTLLAWTSLALAQSQRIDVVYLRNGSIIKGNILEFVPDSLLKIETLDGSIFVFPSTDVAKIEKISMPAEKLYRAQGSNKLKSICGWGLLTSWTMTVVGSGAMGDVMFGTTIIPVLGPFVTISRLESRHGKYGDYWRGVKGSLALSGILQTGFMIGYTYSVTTEPAIPKYSLTPNIIDGRSIGIRVNYKW